MSSHRLGRLLRSGTVIFAVATLIAGAAMAQSNTTLSGGQSASPVLIGNNSSAAAVQSSTTRNAGSAPWSFFSSGSSSAASNGPSMSDLMKQTTATMTSNSDALAAVRDKQLMQDAADQRAKYDKEVAANGKNGKAGVAPQAAPVSMQYKAPDTNQTPARTFSIE